MNSASSTFPDFALDGNALNISWNGADGKEITSSGAVPFGEELTLKLIVDRRVALSQSPTVTFTRESDGYSFSLSSNYYCLSLGTESYFVRVSFDKTGLYFFRVTSGSLTFQSPVDFSENIQLTVYDGGKYAFSDALAGGIIYQIFPDRFSKSERFSPVPKKDAILRDDWDTGIPVYPDKPGGEVDSNDFFGGSLYGVVDRLDYLVSLGVGFIYLNPIFDAHTNHKYDTGDYMTVDSMFGGNSALLELITEAKKRGIGIILDGVFNHTGSDSLYFNRLKNYPGDGAYNSEKSSYHEWYCFSDSRDEYACWWGVKILPATNKNSDSFRKFIFGENGVVRHYIKMGICGWRLDVADELPDDFITGIHNAVKAENSDGFVIGEVWEDASNKIAYDVRRKYLLGHELDSVMNYPLRNAIIDYLLFEDASIISSAVERLKAHYPKPALDSMMNLVGTHDTVRILNQLACSSSDYEELTNEQLSHTLLTPEQRAKGLKLVKLAYLLCAALPGVPCIYYGDERGMEGWRDPFNRLPMKWDDSNKLLTDFYRKIGEIRCSHNQFKHGNIEFIKVDGGFLVFSREDIVIVINRSEEIRSIRFSKPRRELTGGKTGLCFDIGANEGLIFSF